MQTRLLRLTLATLVAVAGATIPGATQAADPADPAAPVVVDDTVTLWPGQQRQIDLLANDSDPGGDELALCRFPVADWTAPLGPIFSMPSPEGGSLGSVHVGAGYDARGSKEIAYYVCNHVRLTPATLTVVVRDVAPVLVEKVADAPGTLLVTNENDQRIQFRFGDRSGWAPDGRVSVPPHSSTQVTVQRHRIRWTARIGRGGIADFGTVNRIALSGKPLPPPHVPHGWTLQPGPAYRHSRGPEAGLARAPSAGVETSTEVDPLAPVVADDTVTMWPGQVLSVDVLANDSDPGGVDLAPCRLPIGDSFHPAPVTLFDGSAMGKPGTLMVQTRFRATGSHTVHYYVCSRTRLTEATLTVDIRPVAPVDVVADPDRPGFLLITNDNDQEIRFLGSNGPGCRLDLQRAVPAHATRAVRVTRHDVRWFALIDSNALIARGHTRHILLDGPATSGGKGNFICAYVFYRHGAAGPEGAPPGIGASGSYGARV